MKKIYKEVFCKNIDDSYKIFLDKNELKTPTNNEFKFKSQKLIEALANEWKNQKDEILPQTMPLNRYANSIIDKIIPNYDDAINELTEYATNDVICYRDKENSDLLKLQDEKWNPLLKYFDNLDVHFEVSYDVFPIDQDKNSLNNFKKLLEELTKEELALLYFAASVTKSTLLAYLFIIGKINCNELFDLSMIEELWQAENWGKEEEAEDNRNAIKQELLNIDSFLSLLVG